MNSRFHFSFVALVFTAVIVAITFSGCATTEPENLSSQPWNKSRGWTGFPSGMNEGR